MALMLAFAGMFTAGAGAARADTNGNAHVFMNLGTGVNNSVRAEYGQLIDSLRAAAGHNFRGQVLQTQTNDAGLIRLTLTVLANGNQPEVTATLWITPQNLYVQGYSDNSGHTFVFSDTPGNIRDRIRAVTTSDAQQLNFRSVYSGGSSLTQAAGRGRESMPIGFTELRNSALTLANGDNNQMAVARALMFMIQFTSEAARFDEVFEAMAGVMGSPIFNFTGLSSRLQSLENAWRPISRYAANVTRNPTIPPADINGVGTLHSFNDAQRLLRMLLSTALKDPGNPGGPDHDEL